MWCFFVIITDEHNPWHFLPITKYPLGSFSQTQAHYLWQKMSRIVTTQINIITHSIATSLIANMEDTRLMMWITIMMWLLTWANMWLLRCDDVDGNEDLNVDMAHDVVVPWLYRTIYMAHIKIQPTSFDPFFQPIYQNSNSSPKSQQAIPAKNNSSTWIMFHSLWHQNSIITYIFFPSSITSRPPFQY